MNKIYIYIKGDDEIGDIIEKVRQTKEKEIILIIPENCRALLHHVNFEILKNEIERLNKDVYIDSEDQRIINLARNFNINLFLSDVEPQPIMDIRPPKPKIKTQQFSMINDDSKEEDIGKKTNKKRFISLISFKSLFIYSLILGLIFFVIYFFVFIVQTKAEVYLFSKKITLDSLNNNFKNLLVTVKDNFLKPDYQNNIIGGRYIKEELNYTISVTTTGIGLSEVNVKPMLNVVFQNFYDSEITLRDGTRLSFGNNIFKTVERIIIPKGSENLPGIKETTVFLDSVVDQNIDLATNTELKIVAWEEKKIKTADGRLFSDLVKVKTVSSFRLNSGLNQEEEIRLVTENDITNAKKSLQKTLEDLLENQMNIKYNDYIYFFDKSFLKPVEVLAISHSVGARSNTVSITGKIAFETLLIPKKDLEDFIRTLINNELLKINKNLTIKAMNYKVNLVLPFNNQTKTMIVSLNINGELISNVNLDLLKKELRGLPVNQVEDIFKKLKDEYQLPLEKIEFKIVPYWRKTLPFDSQRIFIKVY